MPNITLLINLILTEKNYAFEIPLYSF